MIKFLVGAWKCIKAQVRNIKTRKKITTKEIAERLTTCGGCPFENNGVCDDCGCILVEKVKMPEESCPQSYWHEIGNK